METQLEIALNLGYLAKDAAAGLLDQAGEVGRLINGLKVWAESSATR